MAPRMIWGWNGWFGYLAVCWAGLTLALFWLGPGPSEGLAPLSALLFWALHAGIGLLLLASSQLLLGRVARVRNRPAVVQLVLAAVMAGLCFTPVALLLDQLFAHAGGADEAGSPLVVRGALEFGQLSVPFVLTWLLVNAPSLVSLESVVGRGADSGGSLPAAEAAPPPSPPANGDFWAKVPATLGREVLALSAELHYLRLHTTEGNTLILYPFGQAVTVLADRQGMQIHRSHWVSLDHVVGLRSDGERLYCRIAGALELPVSRPYRRPLRDALATRKAGLTT